MAIGSTVYNFEIQVSDLSRNVFELISLKVARHSSETLDYLLTRVIAYCLEYRKGLEFTPGLAVPEAPALWAHDLTGDLTHWIEVGLPSVDKLHRASKHVPTVAVYAHKDPQNLLRQLKTQKLHRADSILVHWTDPGFLDALAQETTRRNVWELSRHETDLYLSTGGRDLHCVLDSSFAG